MAELKTKKNKASVDAFLRKVTDEEKRGDCYTILKLMQQAAKTGPAMWGTGIIGFGHYHYTYKTGREGDWFQIGFAPRKQDLTLYIMPGFNHYEEQLVRLGKHKTGKCCLYIKRLSDVDMKILKSIITDSVKRMKRMKNQEGCAGE